MFPAQPVRDRSNLAVVFSIGNMIFLPGLRVYGIEQQVGMDVLFVNMCADDHLIIRQVLSRKFHGDFQRQLRGEFSRFKGLDDVITLASIQFSKGTLGVHHLPVLQSGVAVLMIGQNLAVGFISIQHILNGLIQLGISGQNFCNSYAASTPFAAQRPLVFRPQQGQDDIPHDGKVIAMTFVLEDEDVSVRDAGETVDSEQAFYCLMHILQRVASPLHCGIVKGNSHVHFAIPPVV